MTNFEIKPLNLDDVWPESDSEIIPCENKFGFRFTYRTAEDIKKALEICSDLTKGSCEDCPYWDEYEHECEGDTDDLEADALTYIRHLESEAAKIVHCSDCKYCQCKQCGDRYEWCCELMDDCAVTNPGKNFCSWGERRTE